MAILAVKYFIKDDASIIYGILRKCPFFWNTPLYTY